MSSSNRIRSNTAAERVAADTSAAKIAAALPAVLELNVTGTILCVNASWTSVAPSHLAMGYLQQERLRTYLTLQSSLPRLRLAFGLLAIYLECLIPDQEDMSLNPL
jgi:hypothetical protein